MNHEQEDIEDYITFDIRQQEFWKAYLLRKSETYGNAKRSAMAVGYSDQYSETITNAGWFKAKMRRKSLLNKAERVLDRTLDMPTLDKEGLEDAALVRVQNDTAKFVAKTLGKDEGYTERVETTGKDGQPIVFIPMELMDKYNLGGDKTSDVELDKKENNENN